MSDLTFMDNGNPTFHPDGLINFSKCTLIYQHIRHLIMKQVGGRAWEPGLQCQDILSVNTLSIFRIKVTILRRCHLFMKACLSFTFWTQTLCIVSPSRGNQGGCGLNCLFIACSILSCLGTVIYYSILSSPGIYYSILSCPGIYYSILSCPGIYCH